MRYEKEEHSCMSALLVRGVAWYIGMNVVRPDVWLTPCLSVCPDECVSMLPVSRT